MSALVAPSGECLRGEGLVWLIRAVVRSITAAAGPIVAHTMNGRISAAAPLALADQLALPMIVKRGWSVRRAIRVPNFLTLNVMAVSFEWLYGPRNFTTRDCGVVIYFGMQPMQVHLQKFKISTTSSYIRTIGCNITGAKSISV